MPTATAPTRSFYTFTGYWDATSGGTQYYTAAMVSARAWDKTANTTLYARWLGNTYTVTFDKQSGSGGTVSVTARYGSAMPTATAPTRTGYTFAGYWDAISDGTQYYTSAMVSARTWDKTVNSTLYARWTINQYTVTFNSSGGTAITSQTINYGSLITEPLAPTKTGFKFAGWYKEVGFTTPWIFNTDTIPGNITLYAKFTDALWARSVTTGTNASIFTSVVADSSGNIYAVGSQSGTGSYTYGAGVSVTGKYSNYNVVLVKYNSSGTALWAKSVLVGTNDSYFNSVAVDSSGNIYAAGYQTGTGSFTYSAGVSVAGTSLSYNVVLVKYDSSGTVLWAKSVTTGSNASVFNSVAVDSSGNIYAAGYQTGIESYTYSAGVSVSGTISSANVVLVKYNSLGTALWAKSVTSGTSSSSFNSVAVDSSGNIYAAGSQGGTGSYTYGGVSVAGTANGNIVLVKYNSSGTALWARSVTAGTDTSEFNSVTVDSSGNIYSAGIQRGTGSITYGSGVSVSGIESNGNVVLVKYSSSGTALWAKSITAGTNISEFYSIAVDASDDIYAVGRQIGIGSYTYGTGISVAGKSSSDNVVLVKYNSSGTTLWAKSVTAGTSSSSFNSVAVDASGNIYAGGRQGGTGSFTYGLGVSVAGAYSLYNAVLVKYDIP